MADIQERKDSKGRTRYTARIRVRGFRPQSATFDTLTAAKTWAQRLESDIKRGVHLPEQEAKRRTLSDAIDRYRKSPDYLKKEVSTRTTQDGQLDYWRDQLGFKTLASLTPTLIADARDILQTGEDRNPTKPRTPATVVRYLAALSKVLSYTVKELGWIQDNPCLRVTKPEEPRGRVRFLSEDERGALLDACKKSSNPAIYDFVVLALCTGARRGELRSLEWRHVDFKRRVIVLDKTKNGDRRVIPIRGEAEKLLEARSKIRHINNPFVFPAPHVTGESPKPLHFQAAWYGALKDANIEDFKFHDLRHTAASHLAMNGATLAELAEVLGHRTLQMVKRYSHFTETHTGDLLERMGDSMFKNPKSDDKKAQ